MKRNIASILYTVLLFGSCYNVNCLESENIVGGEYAVKKQFGYMISVQLGTNHYCGGALIAANKILTAAHCFYNISISEFKDRPWSVVAGGIVTTDFTHRILVKTIYIHANYSGTPKDTRYDIAVAALADSFMISETSPITIATLAKRGEDFLGQQATVAGFGYDQVEVRRDCRTGKVTEKGSSSKKLKYGRVIVETGVNDPDTLFFFARMVQRSQGRPEGICTGDSGSSLVVKEGSQFKVIGILNAGPPGCDESSSPSSYTAVSQFESFIRGVMTNNIGTDTVIKKIEPMIFKIPSIGASRLITTSKILQPILENLQELDMKFTEGEKTLNKLQLAIDTSIKKYQALSCRRFVGKQNTLAAENKEYEAHISEYYKKYNEMLELQNSILNGKAQLSALGKTEKLFAMDIV